MSSSYLLEVLNGEGEEYLLDINSKISEIVQQINTLKSDVKRIIDDGYINFKPFVKENDMLQIQAHGLISEMNLTKQKIENEIKPELSSCSIELENLSESLQEVNISLDILNQLLEIHSGIKNANIKLANKQYYKCSKMITNIQNLIKNNHENLKDLDIFKILLQEVTLAYEQLIHQISEMWSLFVCFDVTQQPDSTVLSLSIDDSFDDISQILKASNCLKHSLLEKQFSGKLLNNVLNEIIQKKVEIIKQADEKIVLTLDIKKNSKSPHYTEVFENIIEVVSFLKEHLHNRIVDEYDFLSKLGSYIADDLIDSLIKYCLSETIPTNSEDLERYKEVVSRAETFQKKLQEIGFLPQDCTSLIDYAKNVNVLFANKFCQSYLEKARAIMKKDLHNITLANEIVLDKIEVLPLNHRNIIRNKLNCLQSDVISFPKCQVSKSAEELLNLIQTMLDEILKSEDLCAVRLFYTIRNIFEMYSAIVPLHHKKFLETLPQQVAIFHNNCIYFTHYLISITCEYFSKIPKILKDYFTVLLEEAILLRSLAIESLELHVSSQRNQLIYILRDSGLATLNEEPKLNPNSEKSIRQCLRQLQILQTVWHDVLPSNVYSRSIGFLLDSFTEESINLIINVEDMSADTASDLVSMFTIILDRGPNLFADPKEIYRHTKKWQRFKEFVLVLKGTLRDIDDRWSNGMGPLANEFTAEQVKHLIRALFQNSERRAALLARIK